MKRFLPWLAEQKVAVSTLPTEAEAWDLWTRYLDSAYAHHRPAIDEGRWDGDNLLGEGMSLPELLGELDRLSELLRRKHFRAVDLGRGAIPRKALEAREGLPSLLEQAGAKVVQYYDQHHDPRAPSNEDLGRGWCIAMCMHWLESLKLNESGKGASFYADFPLDLGEGVVAMVPELVLDPKLDFWDWVGSGEFSSLAKETMSEQMGAYKSGDRMWFLSHLRVMRTYDLTLKAVFKNGAQIPTGGHVGKWLLANIRHVSEDSQKLVTDMVRTLVMEPENYCLIHLQAVAPDGGAGHAMAARAYVERLPPPPPGSGITPTPARQLIRFFDPNFGDFVFDHPRMLLALLVALFPVAYRKMNTCIVEKYE